jgi:cytochrome c oxidase subunit 2
MNELEIVGAPVDGGTGFQPPVTSLAEGIYFLDNLLHIMMFAILVFATALMLYAVTRYRRNANPTPATFTHNTKIEVAWTIVPVFILLFIGVFTLPELFRQQIIPKADVNIKVTGYQWYWGYEYSDHNFEFDSNMLEREELAEYGYDDEYYLLATDTAVVVPVGKTVVMTVTGGDVIHSWKIPAFGVMQDAVPGRLAQLWFKPEREGIYFGQCSELCGQLHSYMPITAKVVSQEAYEQWLVEAADEFG